jgi:hypothetical protein
VDRTSKNSKLRDLQNVEIQNRQSDHPYGYLFFVTILIVAILDFVILKADVLPYVENFTFYSIFEGYQTKTDITAVKGIFLICALIMSVIFFGLEVKGAIYMQ